MAEHELERRSFPAEMRVDDGDDGPVISGYSAVFNKWSTEIYGMFREQVAPGAFTKTLKEADVRALFNHDRNYVLGRMKSKTLTIEEDDKGLRMEVRPPDAQWARDLVETIKRGDIDSQSFSFVTVKDRWEHKERAIDERTLLEVKLIDVGPVTMAAYPQTSVKARSALLEAAGIDYDALAGVIARQSRGLPLTGEDRDLLTASIDALNGYLRPEPADGHSEEGAGDGGSAGRSVAVLRRRLELAEKAAS